MACNEHHCPHCGEHFMDNQIYAACPYCKLSGITNWFDEPNESPNGDDYDSFEDED